MNNKILQTKLNAISAKILHRNAKGLYDCYNSFFIILTFMVPIAFIATQYVAKGTEFEFFFNTISIVLSGILIIAALISSLILKVNEKITIHKIGLKNNLYIINECDNVAKISQSEQEWFFRYVTEIDQQDNDTFAKTSEKTKKKVYRNALKEIEPGNYSITCPLCNKSPWKYKKGDCQLCGNKIN